MSDMAVSDTELRAYYKEMVTEMWPRNSFTIKQIADELGITQAEVTAYACLLGLGKKGKTVLTVAHKQDRAHSRRKAVARLRSTMTVEDMAKRFSCRPSTIKRDVRLSLQDA